MCIKRRLWVMKNEKLTAKTIRMPVKMANKLKKEAEKAQVTFSNFCNMLLSSDKDELLLERQVLMKKLYEARKKVSVYIMEDNDANNKGV